MRRCTVLLVLAGLCALPAPAQEPKQATPEDPAHNELRALKEELLKAFNNKEHSKRRAVAYRDL